VSSKNERPKLTAPIDEKTSVVAESPTMICWGKNDKTVNQWIIDGKIKEKEVFREATEEKKVMILTTAIKRQSMKSKKLIKTTKAIHEIGDR
jgi:hypothetical protein